MKAGNLATFCIICFDMKMVSHQANENVLVACGIFLVSLLVENTDKEAGAEIDGV